jgi:hypothetical protein
MISDGVLGGVAAERSLSLRLQAEEFRRVKTARSAGKADRPAGLRLPWWRPRVTTRGRLEPILATQPVSQPLARRDDSRVLISA